MIQFKKIGYFLDYMIADNYIGSIVINEADREEIGYYSRIDDVASQDIVLSNKKVIKKGQEFYTRMYLLCGKKL